MKRTIKITPVPVSALAILLPMMLVVSAEPARRDSLVDRHHLRYGAVIEAPTDAPFGAPGETYTCLACHALDPDSNDRQFLIERECRVCHDQERHHILYGSKIPRVTDAPYGAFGELYVCLSCHAIDTESGAVQFPIERNCRVCHQSVETKDVLVDIRPGAYPNPINVPTRGVLPVSILGSIDYDVTRIDVSSLLLEEKVAPVRWSFQEGTDGRVDLAMLFSTKAVVSTLRNRAAGKTYELWITGAFDDGTALQGHDTVVLVGRRSLRGR